jgi:DNA-binding NtrC family response regulator
MQPFPVPVLPTAPRTRTRTALVASADRSFRQRLSETLTGLRWQVREAESGAQAWAEADSAQPEAIIVDSWLPDLELSEFLKDFRQQYPEVDLLTTGSAGTQESPRGPYRQELLYALRRTQDTDTAVWNTAPPLARPESGPQRTQALARPIAVPNRVTALSSPLAAGPAQPPSIVQDLTGLPKDYLGGDDIPAHGREAVVADRLPELIGNAPVILEVSRRVRLVAPRSTPVLIEGPTGSGKELVAEALHRLSARSRKPFVAINCAAIPEALLEAELFGHTRGAFTGAVQGRTGRIEAADGGTLFLDEIGELPLALQSKLLRFVESGELQRVGDNETVKVDARIVTATHRPLAQLTQQNNFRADLYYRLAVFLIRTPSLAEHSQDLPQLVEHFLDRMGRDNPIKRVEPAALAKLQAHDWPGNVRELEHVLERAAILAGDETVITAREIDFGLSVN